MKKASDILKEAAAVIEERGKLRDKDDGERSMGRAVEAYTALRGEKMCGELDGWLFMCILKLARATAGKPHIDDWTDLAGYAALGAEYVSSLTDTGIRNRLDEVRNEWEKEYLVRSAALDKLTRVSEELGLYDVPERGNSTDRQGNNGVIIPNGNEDLSKYADPYTGEVNIPSKENGWIEWDGGRCPVNSDDVVQVMLRDGSIVDGAGSGWYWKHNGFGDLGEIIAYRVVKE